MKDEGVSSKWIRALDTKITYLIKEVNQVEFFDLFITCII